MVVIYHDDEGDLSVLKGKTLAMIGYGNQGRAQALNLRDSGANVIIGN
ncbi:MAG: ketol-acid reductoisomerase, partial [Promethearchaeota archaeon]